MPSCAAQRGAPHVSGRLGHLISVARPRRCLFSHARWAGACANLSLHMGFAFPYSCLRWSQPASVFSMLGCCMLLGLAGWRPLPFALDSLFCFRVPGSESASWGVRCSGLTSRVVSGLGPGLFAACLVFCLPGRYICLLVAASLFGHVAVPGTVCFWSRESVARLCRFGCFLLFSL